LLDFLTDILIIGDGVQNIFAQSYSKDNGGKIEQMVNLILEK
jgi:hypothetical protein